MPQPFACRSESIGKADCLFIVESFSEDKNKGAADRG